ncbi:sulfate transporter [Salpingoeca rosetta]|uniref:Sulfate transporter n=1 Tax=Salpingoeca rosetta (strain ATCC 50818 / BSB-021) TaxID=946362 RepID=F2U868_SALR5|nr:sulfate transporter [Salpingoeca rosetta]EGD72576.1 sulfate transporter [Salpingoeca rosetta]|eukprot:XP_004994399.1 sulfate transporter [Salpingoeca rosetta]
MSDNDNNTNAPTPATTTTAATPSTENGGTPSMNGDTTIKLNGSKAMAGLTLEPLAESLSFDEEDEAKRPKVTMESLKTLEGWKNAVLTVIFTVLPILTWAPKYKENWKEKLAGDARAGLTVGILLIPQGLAYALLAELPVEYGLFSAFIPPLLYGFLGTSSELSTAPVAVVSLLTSAGVSELYDPVTERPQYIGAAISLALLLGFVQMGMGILRLGFIINFLSHSVLSGFTSASALIIALSQLKHVLGISIERSSHVHEVLQWTFEEIHNANWRTVVISLASMAIILFWKYPPQSEKFNWFRKYFKPLPSAMVVVIIFTLISANTGLNDKGVKIVGDVPAGLPTPEAPDTKDFGDLLVLVLTIALVSYMESMAIAKKLADDRNYQLDYNQELVALGACNIVGSFFQTYPTTGGFSRSAVNANAGCKTQLATILAGIVVMIALLAATELFFFLPKAILGSIIIIAVLPLVNFKEPFHLWKISKIESVLTVVTFLLTAFIGVELGVGISIALALLAVVWQASRPHYTLEGRLPGTDVYRNIRRFPDAIEPKGIKIFRFDADIFFVNATVFERQVQKRCYVRGVENVIINFTPVSHVDSTAFHAMEKVLEAAERKGISVYFAGVKGPVRDIFERIGFTEHVGEDHFFKTVNEAVMHLTNEQFTPMTMTDVSIV